MFQSLGNPTLRQNKPVLFSSNPCIGLGAFKVCWDNVLFPKSAHLQRALKHRQNSASLLWESLAPITSSDYLHTTSRQSLLLYIYSALRQDEHTRASQRQQASNHRVRARKVARNWRPLLSRRYQPTLLFLFTTSLLQYIVEIMNELLQCAEPLFDLSEGDGRPWKR